MNIEKIESRNSKGKRHREDWPVKEYSDGTKQWWLNGIGFLKSEWKEQIKDL